MPPISLTRPPILPADLQDRALRRRLTTDLRGAIGRGEMAVHYQPRIFLGDGRLAGAEALLRWQHPLHGAIPPATFIPLAEASDLILRLGGWAAGCCGRRRRRRRAGRRRPGPSRSTSPAGSSRPG
jgi:predicted signal transduction protein with EAL and GGDEF domain